jgi:hypothetical protein
MISAVNAKLANTAEDNTLNYVELRGSEYWEAASLLGSGPEDLHWRAKANITDATSGATRT